MKFNQQMALFTQTSALLANHLYPLHWSTYLSFRSTDKPQNVPIPHHGNAAPQNPNAGKSRGQNFTQLKSQLIQSAHHEGEN